MIWLREGIRLMMSSRSRSLLLLVNSLLLFLLAGLVEWTWVHGGSLRRVWQDGMIVELYLEQDTDPEQIQDRVTEMQVFQWEGLLEQDQAAIEFQEHFGLDIPALLGENPFPRTALLTLKPESADEDWQAALDEFESWPELESIYADPLLLKEAGSRMKSFLFGALATFTLLLFLNLILLKALWASVERKWKETDALLDLAGAGRIVRRVSPALALTLPAMLGGVLFLLVWRVIEVLLEVLVPGMGVGVPLIAGFAVALLPLLLWCGVLCKR